MSHNLPDYNLEPPEYEERSEYVVDLLRIEFDEDYLCEADVNSNLMLKLVKGCISSDELEELRATLESDYNKAFEVYVDANYDAKVDDLNDPY